MKKTTIRRKLITALLFGLGLVTAACAPKVYVIDRPTLMEEESGGEWPDLQKQIGNQMLKKSPSAMKTPESATKQKQLTRSLEPDESLGSGR